MTKTERIENIVKFLKTRKSKNVIYTVVITLVVILFASRFYTIHQENNFQVFNILRDNNVNGVPVNVLTMEKTDGVLYEPLTIKNNRAYVSGARIKVFKTGQKVGNCKIVSVSHAIDLDTGMHVIKTSNCGNGLQYVENRRNGYYVPASAVYGTNVYVMENGVAKLRDITIDGRDSQNVFVKSGLNDGDVVILSHIENDQKVKIIK